MKIIPAILENSLEDVKNKINYFSSIKEKNNLDFSLVQIDFCDGEFVPNKNWLPDNSGELKELVDLAKNFNLEVHLMCNDTRKYFDLAKDVGIKNIIIHIDNIFGEEKTELMKFIDESAEGNIDLGICAKLSFMKEKNEEILSLISTSKDKFSTSRMYMQVMGIENIGKQGEPFAEGCISLIQSIRDLFTEGELNINVDGSVNEATYKLFLNAGASSLVVGSYFIKAESEEEFINRYNLLKS